MTSISSSGVSSGGSTGAGAGAAQEVMEQRKRKRMLSNRESARRSRQRKQKHLDELTAQVSQLRKENGQIVAALNATTQHYLGVEAENSVLRTQMLELSNRLQSLTEILSGTTEAGNEEELVCDDGGVVMMMMMMRQQQQVQPWSYQQPIMAASADMYQY